MAVAVAGVVGAVLALLGFAWVVTPREHRPRLKG